MHQLSPAAVPASLERVRPQSAQQHQQQQQVRDFVQQQAAALHPSARPADWPLGMDVSQLRHATSRANIVQKDGVQVSNIAAATDLENLQKEASGTQAVKAETEVSTCANPPDAANTHVPAMADTTPANGPAAGGVNKLNSKAATHADGSDSQATPAQPGPTAEATDDRHGPAGGPLTWAQLHLQLLQDKALAAPKGQGDEVMHLYTSMMLQRHLSDYVLMPTPLPTATSPTKQAQLKRAEHASTGIYMMPWSALTVHAVVLRHATPWVKEHTVSTCRVSEPAARDECVLDPCQPLPHPNKQTHHKASEHAYAAIAGPC